MTISSLCVASRSKSLRWERPEPFHGDRVRMTRSTHLMLSLHGSFAFGALALVVACSSPTSADDDGTGGMATSGSAGTGGSTNATGGRANTGGTTGGAGQGGTTTASGGAATGGSSG